MNRLLSLFGPRHRSLPAAFTLALMMVSITGQVSAQALEGTLVVANRAGGSISFIDVGSGIEMARHPVGPRIPHEIAISPDGRLALSSRYGGGDNPGETLLVFDVAAATLLGEIELGPDSRPHSFAFLPDNRRAVATMELSDQLALVDVATFRVIDTFPTGGREGHMVRLSPDGTTAYVTSRGAEGTLSIVDLTGADSPVVIATGLGAEGLAVTPDGSEVWVVNRRAASISIVDTGTQRVTATIDAPPFAGRAEISDSGHALVANGSFGGEGTGQRLTVFDVDSRSELTHFFAHPAEESRGGFNLYIAGEHAFVSDRTSNSIAIFDLSTLVSAARLAPAEVLVPQHDSPDGLGYSPLRMNVLNQ